MTLLTAQNLSVGYGKVSVVRDLDLEVHRGELVALLGPNGAGKTTTLMAMVGILAPTSGEVRFQGVRDRAPLHRRARAGLAFVAEERSLFTKLSVNDNLRVAGADRTVALELFPELAKLARRSVGLLSGGEQQMLALALALSRRPSLLIADELSLGLAPLVVDRLLEALRAVVDEHGLGVLLVEQHVQKILRHADRAYVMRRGGVVLEGDATGLLGRVAEIEDSYLSGGQPVAENGTGRQPAPHVDQQ